MITNTKGLEFTTFMVCRVNDTGEYELNMYWESVGDCRQIHYSLHNSLEEAMELLMNGEECTLPESIPDKDGYSIYESHVEEDDTGEPFVRTDINIYYTTEKELETLKKYL